MTHEMQNPYDAADPASIERYAKRLSGRSLRQSMPSGAPAVRRHGKGGFGQMVEELYFGIRPNSDREPDFPLAGVELKTSPLYKTMGGKLRSKERLVLSIINYKELAQEEHFENSTLWRKNKLLLLLFHIWQQGLDPLDYIFSLARLWKFPESDLKIIRDDWKKIVGKVRKGLAHELSEKDTVYLAACTKGASSLSMRDQPRGPRAKQRAFSLKVSYVNQIFERSSRGSVGPIIRNLSDLKGEETFEGYVVRKLSSYYGTTETQLKASFGLRYSTGAKHRYFLLAKAMLGVTADRIEEFEKANIAVKTIRIEPNGKIKESMSFKQIQFKEIIKESWESSTLLAELDRRFLFVVFEKDKRGVLRFVKCGFWAIPAVDLDIVQRVWLDTRKKIKLGRYSEFIKQSENPVAHVRTKGRNNKDLMSTPQGVQQTKRCFWLNRDYIMEQLGSLTS